MKVANILKKSLVKSVLSYLLKKKIFFWFFEKKSFFHFRPPVEIWEDFFSTSGRPSVEMDFENPWIFFEKVLSYEYWLCLYKIWTDKSVTILNIVIQGQMRYQNNLFWVAKPKVKFSSFRPPVDRRSTGGRTDFRLIFCEIALFGVNWNCLHKISIDKDEKVSVVVIQSQEKYNKIFFELLKAKIEFDRISTAGRPAVEMTKIWLLVLRLKKDYFGTAFGPGLRY